MRCLAMELQEGMRIRVGQLFLPLDMRDRRTGELCGHGYITVEIHIISLSPCSSMGDPDRGLAQNRAQ